MKKASLQWTSLLLLILWCGYSGLVFISDLLGDCIDARLCDEIKSANLGLVFWRWLAGCLILLIAYRYLRKDVDVQ